MALKNGLSALLDTGAYFPVWTDLEEVLMSGMGGTLVRKHVPFIGFGGTTYGNIGIGKSVLPRWLMYFVGGGVLLHPDKLI